MHVFSVIYAFYPSHNGRSESTLVYPDGVSNTKNELDHQHQFTVPLPAAGTSMSLVLSVSSPANININTYDREYFSYYRTDVMLHRKGNLPGLI